MSSGKIKNLIEKYKDIIAYGFFGVLTTVINWVTYKVCFGIIGIPNVPSTVIAWILAVIFAFLTNKVWVFNSRSFKKDIILKEGSKFLAARILTGVMDVIIMWIAVDLCNQSGDVWKLISNILVIIANYIASKFFIF